VLTILLISQKNLKSNVYSGILSLIVSIALIMISILSAQQIAAANPLFQQALTESIIPITNGFKLKEDIFALTSISDNKLILMSNLLADVSVEQSRHPQTSRHRTIPDNFSTYENSDHKIKMQVPTDWKIVEGESSINFSSPRENDLDILNESLHINISPFKNTGLETLASLEIIEYRQSLIDFKLLNSVADKVASNRAYKIEYTYRNGQDPYQAMKIWTIIEGKTYTFTYLAEPNKYSNYLSSIQKMINSLEIYGIITEVKTREYYPELKISTDPYDFAFNPITKKYYVTNMRFHTVSVIDGSTERPITEIKVGNFPLGISVNPDTNMIYVANSRSNTVSVIDGSINKVIANITIGNKPSSVIIDTDEKGVDSLAFVANSYSGTVSVIDAASNSFITNIMVEARPGSMTINPIINRLYVANSESNTISVIDYFLNETHGFINKKISEIKVDSYPTSIDLNRDTNRLYVANSDSNIVSVIDGSTNEVMSEIELGSNPYGLAVNKDTNRLYVANYFSDIVSVIDGSINKVIANIPVGKRPVQVSHNPITDMMYVANLNSKTISIINDTNIVAGITYNINPSNSGTIECNKRKISDGDYVRYDISKDVNCKANANSDSNFRSWTGD
jgi:YVTN family beta-propeller protein